jgi:phosphoribosylformylglycinamidine synthase II
MGIPTVNGAVVFDEDFKENPLVFCGTLGLMPQSTIPKDVQPGDKIVMTGGRVGRDGIHGATFSSDTLTTGIPSSVVQIGNPIVQKKMMDVLLEARDQGLYRGITDCGAGGLSSAVGEMGEKTGAEVNLERVPLKYAGIAPWEIWLSESQERMVLAVPPPNLGKLKKLFADEDVDCSDIGTFSNDGRLTVKHNDEVLVDMDMAFLHDGVPKRAMASRWAPPAPAAFPHLSKKKKTSLESSVLAVLAQPTVASKEWVVRQYDHEVQGRTVGKPFVGPRGVGPSDAAVLQLDPRSRRGAALSCGINPHYSRWDPYWMSASAIDEAVRNVVAVGARTDRISILDNFCGGNPWRPEILGELVRTAQACHDIALAYGTPFISGKDSLFNEFVVGGSRRAIPTTLLISALSVWWTMCPTLVTMDLKKPENPHLMFWVKPETNWEAPATGLHLENQGGSVVPHLNPRKKLGPCMKGLAQAIQEGMVVSCHDCSEGGLGVTLAEMAFRRRIMGASCRPAQEYPCPG